MDGYPVYGRVPCPRLRGHVNSIRKGNIMVNYLQDDKYSLICSERRVAPPNESSSFGVDGSADHPQAPVGRLAVPPRSFYRFVAYSLILAQDK